jgi:hypothetical protein
MTRAFFISFLRSGLLSLITVVIKNNDDDDIADGASIAFKVNMQVYRPRQVTIALEARLCSLGDASSLLVFIPRVCCTPMAAWPPDHSEQLQESCRYRCHGTYS